MIAHIAQEKDGDLFWDWFHVVKNNGNTETMGITSEGRILDSDGFSYDASLWHDLDLPREFYYELKERGVL